MNMYPGVQEWIIEDDPRADILIDMSEYADKHPNFCAKFLDSVRRQFDQTGKMSAKQYNQLLKVYNAFHMGSEKEERKAIAEE